MEFIKNAFGLGAQGSLEQPIVAMGDGKIWLDVLAHVQDIGDTRVAQGQHLISFPGKRIEGLQICHTIPDVEFKYMGHIENQGDSQWASHGNFVGTRGMSRRLEGIAVRIEGKAAAAYDVKYYVQMNGKENSPVAMNGEFAGTRGESRRVEGVAIWLEPKQILTAGDTPKGPEETTYASWNLTAHVGDSDDIDAQYQNKCTTYGDIHEHMPTLYKYAKECNEIAEFGVRSVVSTWAFLRGLRDSGASHKKLICCDLEKSGSIARVETAAKKNNIEFEFITGNDLNVDLKGGVDLLFIDTWHVYPQLKRELEIHASKARKYIIMHDTTVDAESGESVRCGYDIRKQAKESGFSEADIRTGLSRALKEFLETHADWTTKEVFTNCNGLTILERVAPAPMYTL